MPLERKPRLHTYQGVQSIGISGTTFDNRQILTSQWPVVLQILTVMVPITSKTFCILKYCKNPIFSSFFYIHIQANFSENIFLVSTCVFQKFLLVIFFIYNKIENLKLLRMSSELCGSESVLTLKKLFKYKEFLS